MRSEELFDEKNALKKSSLDGLFKLKNDFSNKFSFEKVFRETAGRVRDDNVSHAAQCTLRMVCCL
jgi:hypothetical protein